MKKLITILLCAIATISFAQVPQGVSYQAIATNAQGLPIVSGSIAIRLSILNNTATGTVLYTETQTKTTNAQGLFNVIIGQGTPTLGTFASINWSVNNKFLRVEMDSAGGSNFVFVGATQLLTVPYAMVAAGIRTPAGQGITLTSPNGTPYNLAVNDSGQLSLPTSGVQGTVPNNYYMYGTFNNYNPTTALLFGNQNGQFVGYKYFPAGSELKFLSSNNAGATVIGVDAQLNLIVNGAPYTFAGNGFYYFRLINFQANVPPLNQYLSVQNVVPKLFRFPNNASTLSDLIPTYNVNTNTFSFIANGVSTSTYSTFIFNIDDGTISSLPPWGDNLADGFIDYNGAIINFPNVTATPKNFRVDLILNHNGSGSYTITQI